LRFYDLDTEKYILLQTTLKDNKKYKIEVVKTKKGWKIKKTGVKQ